PSSTAIVPRSISTSAVRALRTVLAQEARQVPGRLAAIYWEDLDGRAAVQIRPAKVFKSASLIKIPVAAAVLALCERHPDLRTPDLQQQLWKMIALSDHVAVDILAEHVGGLGAINRFCRAHGWRETSMNYYFRNWRTRRTQNTTSARDVAAMLRGID